MAVQRLSLSQIETQILEITGYASSATAPWASSATLYLRINDYIQRLPTLLAATVPVVRNSAKLPPLGGVPRWDMWLTEEKCDTATGDSKVYLPEDYDHYLLFWDATNSREIDVVTNVERYHAHLKGKTAGPPEAIELMGGLPSQSAPIWLKYGTLYPSPPSDTKPDITLKYWRIPRKMPGSSATTEYPDIDPKYELLPVYGTSTMLMRSTDPAYERYKAMEQEMLGELALTARAAN